MTRWRARAEVGLAIAVVGLPIVVATARARVRHWFPMGDNAYFTIRAHDVLTEHHPLVGAWSSGSASVGVEVNNLGPLQIDLLAAPVRLLGAGPGTAVGVAAVNLLASASVVVLLHRRLGSLGTWVGAAAAAATAWTLGSELLFEPRQHHALVLPFLAFLVATAAAAAGERWALPVALAWGSLAAQTHLTFAVPVALLVVGAAVALLAGRVAGWRPGWGRGPWLASAAVVLVLWVQPLIEELGAGEGNLSALRRAATADQQPYGVARALRATAEVLLPPSGWWRGSFRAFDPVGGTPPLPAALAGLALALGLLGGVGWWARRRRDRPVAALAGVAGAAVVAGVLGAARSPVDGPFGAVPGNFRFLWPIGALLAAALVVGALRAAPRPTQARAPAVLAMLSLVLAVAALPTSYQSPGPEADAPLIPVARSLVDQLDEVDLPSPVRFERGDLYFGEPFTYVVVWGLVHAGVDVVFEDPVDLARFGDERAPDQNPPVVVVVTLLGGDAALEAPAAEVLARASLLRPAEQEELARLRALSELSPAEEARRDDLLDRHRRGTVAVVSSPP